MAEDAPNRPSCDEYIKNIQRELKGLVGGFDKYLEDVAAEKNTPLYDVTQAAIKQIWNREVAFSKRLLEYTEAKQALSEYLVEQFMVRSDGSARTAKTLFVESGSLGAWCAMRLKNFRDEAGVHRFVTNNKTFSDILFGTAQVWQTEGWVDPKYSGILPFDSRDDSSSVLSLADVQAFMHLHSYLARQEFYALLLNASSFNFALGPMTASPQNALFKAAAFSVPRRIVLALPAEKLITVLGNEGDSAWESMHRHVEQCYTVFRYPLGHSRLVPAVDRMDSNAGRSAMGLLSMGVEETNSLEPGWANRTWLDLPRTNSKIEVVIAYTQGDYDRIQWHVSEVNEEIRTDPTYGYEWEIVTSRHDTDVLRPRTINGKTILLMVVKTRPVQKKQK